jgi:hypothetical protein
MEVSTTGTLMDSTFTKQRGVPLPPAARRSNKGYSAAVLSLQPGESVFLPISRKAAYDVVHRLAWVRSEIDFKEYAIRHEGDGARVWRLEK